VGVWVPVGRAVSVGNAVEGVEGGKVGKGVNVGKSKLNKAVGVAAIPSLGKAFGLGTIVEEFRGRNKLIKTEQRQQNTSRSKLGKTILPTCPCWLYVLFNVERNELNCFVIFSIITCQPLFA